MSRSSIPARTVARVTDPNSVFPSGVASGDVTATEVVLWTRVDPAVDPAGGAVAVRWQIAIDGEAAVAQGVAHATPEHDHCIHVEVDGLVPGTDHRYTFEFGDARIEGRTRTLPATSDHFRFVVACCSRWGWQGFDLFDDIVAERPDLLLHLGDSIYEVGEVPPDGTVTDPPWECHTLDDYRRRYRQHRSHRALRNLLATVPMIVVWDDHEVVDNAPRPAQEKRRIAGQRAWAEWMPNRRTDEPGPLDRQTSIAGLLDLAVVDSRFGGRVPHAADRPGGGGETSAGILAADQWDRLERFSSASDAPWFVMANQVQVSPMLLAARPAPQWPPWRPIVNPDQWDGYPRDRKRLVRILRDVVGEPVVLSGDLHSAWSRTLRDGDGAVAHEFTSPSISGSTYAQAVRTRLPVPAAVLGGWLRLVNRGIDHLDLVRHGFVVCDVTTTEFVGTFVTADGARHRVVLDRGDRSSP